MNLAVEFHDSHLARLEATPDSIRLMLQPAMLHSSEGVPGRDSGTVASGSAELTFFGAVVAGGSNEPSGAISEAEVQLDGVPFEELIPVPWEYRGAIQAAIKFADGSICSISASRMTSTVTDVGTYLDTIVV